MKLYIANNTCSQAAQLVANELGVELQLVHVDFRNKSTSNGEDFATVNPLLYVPALQLDDNQGVIAETIIIASYLADQHPEAGLIPRPGTLERVKMDEYLFFAATEIAQKHIPLMRKLMTDEGIEFNTRKLLTAYGRVDDQLADGRPYLFGDEFTVADAYTWATLWNSRSGVNLDHLKHLAAWKARVDRRPAAIKSLEEESEIVAKHRARNGAGKD